MDRVVKVRRSFLNEIRAFLNVFASMCKGCFRASCDCGMSDEITRAKNLIVRIDCARDAEEERYFVENPNEEFLAKVVEAVRQGGGESVRSQEISIPGASRQRKSRALKTLVRRGVLERTEIGGEIFYAETVRAGANSKNEKRKQ